MERDDSDRFKLHGIKLKSSRQGWHMGIVVNGSEDPCLQKYMVTHLQNVVVMSQGKGLTPPSPRCLFRFLGSRHQLVLVLF